MNQPIKSNENSQSCGTNEKEKVIKKLWRLVKKPAQKSLSPCKYVKNGTNMRQTLKSFPVNMIEI